MIQLIYRIDLKYVSSNYSFLKKHERIADSNKWLNYNSVTHISKSFDCKCNINTHTNKHVCATELVSGDESGSYEGAFFLEKIKCSSCDETFIIENGVWYKFREHFNVPWILNYIIMKTLIKYLISLFINPVEDNNYEDDELQSYSDSYYTRHNVG